MKPFSEHVHFIYALFDKPLPKRPSSNLWTRMQKRLSKLLGRKSRTSNVEAALAHTSKLSLTISKSFNISQGPQLDEMRRNELKEILISFLNNGRRISECTKRQMRRKKELIRSLLRKTIEEWNRCILEINGAWLQGYGHVYHDRGKPYLLDKSQAVALFNEFIDCHLIPCKDLRESALVIKSVFTTNGDKRLDRLNSDRKHQPCSFKLSNES